MYYNRHTTFPNTPRPLLARQNNGIPSLFQPLTFTFPTADQPPSLLSLFDSRHSFLLSPSRSEYDSLANEERVQQPSFSYHPPINNYHASLFNRNPKNCISHPPSRPRHRRIHTEFKANHSQQFTTSLPRFLIPDSDYDPPIHIHHRTPESLILGLLCKLANVRLYVVDSKLDQPTPKQPNALPALIQIQAIHHANSSTILLIEVQYLPPSSTSLHNSIHRLCRMIFSPSNTIIAWGDVDKKLLPFSKFDLFDPFHINNAINLQTLFKQHWNSTHPHTNACIERHQPTPLEPMSDDVLICLINSDDVDDEFDASSPHNDFNTCICPPEIRPYKAKDSLWSLQKAVQVSFNETSDTSSTYTLWSCGLDLSLHTWHNLSDKNYHLNLVHYALYDLLASTKLLFQIQSTHMLPSTFKETIYLHPISFFPSTEKPTYVVITDSHGKFLPPVTVRPDSVLIVKAISGLQWIHSHDNQLSCQYLLQSPTYSTLLSTCRAVLFIVGSNSIRHLHAAVALQQVEQLLDFIHSHHSHLTNRHAISIAYTFPCRKTSSYFSTPSSLMFNINAYNQGLQALSIHKSFTTIQFPIFDNHLSPDGLHIRVDNLFILVNGIEKHFNEILLSQSTQPTRPKSTKRSRSAIKRRNKLRHDKLRSKQKLFTLIRPIARVWRLNELKQYLTFKQIRYGHLPEIYNHKLRIQFHNQHDLDQAERILSFTDFDDSNHSTWTAQARTQ